MPRNSKPKEQELAVVCRKLAAARQRVAELEARRNQIISALRAEGVPGAELAVNAGLSPGRVTQITNHRRSRGRPAAS